MSVTRCQMTYLGLGVRFELPDLLHLSFPLLRLGVRDYRRWLSRLLLQLALQRFWTVQRSTVAPRT